MNNCFCHNCGWEGDADDLIEDNDTGLKMVCPRCKSDRVEEDEDNG